MRHGIDGIIAGRRVLVFSNGALRKAAIATFDRTFRITYALEAVAIAVAVMGIAGALLAMVIDRRREFALLRFLGATQAANTENHSLRSGAIGAGLANRYRCGTGTLLSLILIFVINKQSFRLDDSISLACGLAAGGANGSLWGNCARRTLSRKYGVAHESD